MAIVLDLIREALSKIGAIDPTETPDADQIADALITFNDILDSWSIQNLMVYTNVVSTYTLTMNVGSYTVGPTGVFVGARPGAIDTAYVTYNGYDFPLSLHEESEYAQIGLKSQTGMPQWLIYNPDYPNGTIMLWPVPYAAATLTIYQNQLFIRAASANTTFDMAPGFRKALRLCLSWDLVDDYPGMDAMRLAKLEKDKNEAVAALKRINSKPELLSSEVAGLDCSGGGGVINWRAGA